MANYSGYSKWSDRELFENLPLDSGRTAELISRYMNIVFSSAKRLSSAADYEELVSDGMEGLLNAIQSYDADKGEFAAFAAVCVKNSMRNTVKRTARRNSEIYQGSAEDFEDIPDPSPTPEEVVIQREDSRSVLENLRGKLTEMELHCIEGVALGFSYEEIAKHLKTDRKSVDNALCRARAKLRRLYML